MAVWLAVVVAGIAGGLLSTFLPAGMDVGPPPSIAKLIEHHDGRELLFHFARNCLFGGVASFLLWGGYTPGASFDKTDPAVQLIVASFIFGGGGVGTVNAFFRQAQQGRTIQNLTEAVDILHKERNETEED
jgi:hypothetical protein